MKKNKNIILPLVVLVIAIVASAYTKETSSFKKKGTTTVLENKQQQTVNLFVTHGHCSTPFAGIVEDLEVKIPVRIDLGNPLENMEISFAINPNSFNVCAGKDLTKRIKTPGLFIGKNDEKITFKSTNIYTMGIDWYQVNGKMSIKGVEKEVKLFVTGIRKSYETSASSLVIESKMNLFDWGIDYDKIVNGKSTKVATKWLHMNMRVKIS
ncbi:YceI family protein [Tenacibaculum insulae]|uniref:YceI family protein n=1 Tax=Tenacibaculum insulae TaxID=2029677 RepID=UPI003AB396D9